MNKVSLVLAIGLLSIGLIGCSQSKETSQNNPPTVKQDAQQNNSVKKESSVKFPEGQAEMGKGKIDVRTPAGTSENGNVPVLFVKGDETLVQIGLDGQDLDGTKQSYIFVDKKLITKEQLANAQMTLDLDKDLLKVGTHTVYVVEFENNDPNGKVVEYHEAKYETKK